MSATVAIAWSPLLPWSVIAGLAGLAAAAVALAAWRRARGIVWRALAVLAILGVLANPTLVREQRERLADITLVAMDASASQDIPPRGEQMRAIREALDGRLAELRDTEVRTIRAGRPDSGPPADGTRLFDDIARALAEIPRERLAGLVIVSDGQVHDVPEGLDELGIEAPVHVLLTGGAGEGDRRLTIGEVPSYGIVGKEITLTVTVEDLPAPAERRTARLRLTRDGGEPEVARVPVGEPQEITFELEHRGPTVLEVATEAGPRELTMANNRAAVMVNGVRDRLRVLLVSGEPHAGERAWRHLLKSDPSVDLVHFTILRPPEKQDGTPIRELSLIAFPTRELFQEKIGEFDLIVFDRYHRRGVLPRLYLDNVAAYVRDGGALLEAGGPSFGSRLSLFRTPLGDILPAAPTGRILEQGFRPAVTDPGQRHPVTADLPGANDANSNPEWGRWFRHVAAQAGAGDVLMEGVEGRPLLILQRVGEGRVAQLLSDHAWLWARGYDGGGPQAELMRRVAHWLMKEPELEEEDLRARVADGTLTITRRSMTPELPEVTITRPEGSTTTAQLRRAAPGRAVAEVAVERIGMYEVDDGTRTALAAAGALNPLEYRDVRATAERLRPLVEASGGAVTRFAEAGVPSLRKVRPGRERAGRGWIGLQANGAYHVAGVAEVPLLPAVLALALVIATLILAWFREGR